MISSLTPDAARAAATSPTTTRATPAVAAVAAPVVRTLTLAEAVANLRRAARTIRQDAYGYAMDTPERECLLAEARAMDALATNHALLIEPVHQVDAALGLAIELALKEIDAQADAGIPRQAQQINYAAIYAEVRGTLAGFR